MKTNLKKVWIYRRYSEDFKKQLVADYESGHYSIVELERLHGINNASIYRWVYKYSTFNKKGYRVVGISKQAVYQYGKRQTVFDGKVTQLIVDADQLRDAHPGCGVAKMYYILKPDFIGRDLIVSRCFASLSMIVRQNTCRIKTLYLRPQDDIFSGNLAGILFD